MSGIQRARKLTVCVTKPNPGHYPGAGAVGSKRCAEYNLFMSTPAVATSDKFEIGGRAFTSRLIIGTGKYPTFEKMKAAPRASRAGMVTVAVRRVSLDSNSQSVCDHTGPSLAQLSQT